MTNMTIIWVDSLAPATWLRLTDGTVIISRAALLPLIDRLSKKSDV